VTVKNMTDRNHTHDAIPEDAKPGVLGNDPLDRELGAALARYAEVEPRAGLEVRVLANLRAERALRPRSSWAWPRVTALAGAALILVAVAVDLRISGRETKVVHHPPLIRLGTEVATHKENLPAMPNPVAARKRSGRSQRPLQRMVPAGPKLDVFPSPQPLSEQEKMLQYYVAGHPEQALLVARALTNALRPDQLKEMRPFPSGDRATDSIERNNDTTER
jgi:hypothetical protein